MKNTLIALVVLVSLTGCKKEAAECPTTSGSSVAPANERTQVTTYLSTNNITNGVELGNSGMFYVIDAAGDNNKPGQCSNLTVKYSGKFEDGTVFDQTTGTNVAYFSLGQLIEGWKRGLPLIGAGGKIRLYIPPTLGYGANGVFNSSTGVYIIPKNAMLIFTIEIINVSS